MLSAADAAALVRGRNLKRCVRAASALRGLYDDSSLAEETGAGRGAVAAWWRGAKPSPGTLQRIADVTGLSLDELTRYVYFDGPLPHLPEPSGLQGLRQGVERAEERPDDEAPDTPAQSPELRPRDADRGLD